jgi:hypothetical protein
MRSAWESIQANWGDLSRFLTVPSVLVGKCEDNEKNHAGLIDKRKLDHYNQMVTESRVEYWGVPLFIRQ